MKTSVYVGTSLDGCISRKDGDIEWLTPFNNSEVYDSYNEFIKNIDAIVIGRGTFEKVLSFSAWPYVQPVIVLSNSIKQLAESLKAKATLLSMKPKDLLKHLSEQNFSNIYIDGGRVIQDFLNADCIDELIITKVPVVLGSGISLFGNLEKELTFTHLNTSIYSNGLVKSHYQRKRE
jgi:dihydrofolate reductase